MKKSRHLIIIGPTGSGKSHLVNRLLLDGSLGSRVLVIDLKNEYTDLGPWVEIEEAIQEIRSGEKSFFIYRFIPEDDIETGDILDLAFALGDVTVVCEEVGDYSNHPELRRTMRRGRSEGIRVVAITQRPAEVSKTVTSQANLTLCFKTIEPVDVEYIRKKFGVLGVQDLEDLDPHNYDFAYWGDEDFLEELGLRVPQDVVAKNRVAELTEHNI